MCALLDLTKAFHIMNHHGLFIKLMEKRIPVASVRDRTLVLHHPTTKYSKDLKSVDERGHASIGRNTVMASIYSLAIQQ